ncbi:MAG: hypothetical protein HY770_08125 [Chitinivibrionia bacterium]|nr:hypothetical protein [Chitinivibrionia bacterium]
MFKLRQAMGSQAIPTLVAASLLSKKLAVGVRYAGLDIRVAPHGNFGGDWQTASANGRLFVSAARMLGIEAAPILTNASFPYQPYLGRRESLVALDDIFRGEASPWLHAHSETCRMLAMACLPSDLRGKLASLSTGELRRHFKNNVVAQGGSPDDFDEIVAETRRMHSSCIAASQDGFCSYPLGGLRDVLVQWQMMSRCEHKLFPDPVGIILLVPPGGWVAKGTPIATVRASSDMLSEVIQRLGQIIGIPNQSPSGANFEAINE